MTIVGLLLTGSLSLSAAAAQSSGAPARPPESKCPAPEHRQLDFWIGDWRAQDAKGELLGTSRIESLLGGCVLQENWTSPRGSGKSFILYTPTDGKWHYTWVDDNAYLLFLDGGFKDGKMVMTGESSKPGEQGKTLNRMTWEPAPQGRVHQVYETSSDGGKTWTVAFDGFYVKR